jgi:Protein of unknown function (DUF3987)
MSNPNVAAVMRGYSAVRANSADSWAEPLDIIGAPELVGWPVLTQQCLPPPLYHYVTAEAERLGVDPCPIAMHVLAACSAVASDHWSIKMKQHDPWTQQARIWSCVIKPVGSRGTEMLRSAFWPIRKLEQNAYRQWEREHAAWKERQKARGKESDETDPEPALHRHTTNDATIEAAVDLLSRAGDHAKIAMKCDELMTFLEGFNRYSPNGAAARALWLESYDGGPQHIDRVRRGFVRVPNWSVVVAGNIQTRRLENFKGSLTDDGLFQRFSVVHAKPADLVDDDDQPINTSIGVEYREIIETLAELSPAIGADGTAAHAYANPDARAVRQALRPLIERLQIDTSLPAIVRETAPKWSGLLARLTLIFHLVGLADRMRMRDTISDRERQEVTGATADQAAAFIRHILLPNLFRLGYETMPDSGEQATHVRWIAGHVLAHKLTSITARQIGRAYNALRGKDTMIMQAMETLTHAGWATRYEGRVDSACWNINPAVHQAFAEQARAEAERRAHMVEMIRAKITDL